MRKILFSLLLATTMATPALAERPGHHDDSSNRTESHSSDHSQARSDHSGDRGQRAEARQEMARPQGDARVQNVERMNAARGQAFARQQANGGARFSGNVNERGRPTLGGDGGRMTEGVAQWQGRQREQIEAQQQQQAQQQSRDARQRYDRQQGDRNWDRNRQGSRSDRQAYNQRQGQQWNSNWRNDRRYNWRDYRNRHRSTFHIGVYYDPFGYGYQRYNIGYQMQPNYYGSNYWLNDPAMYALPYAPFPFRWVRYYNDALLVNTYTGQVADVIYDFFW